MPKPTQAALKRKPAAVIMLTAMKDAPGLIAAYDYEWFETAEGRAEFWDALKQWADDDVQQHGDVVYYLANVSDTADGGSQMVVDEIAVVAPDAVDHQIVTQFLRDVKDDVTLLVAPTAQRVAATGGGKRAKKPVVKGRKPSTAAGVVKGQAAEDDAPKPKAVQARKAVKAAQPKTDGTPDKAAPKPRGDRAAALKARLQAKQAADVGEVTPDAVAKIGKEDGESPETIALAQTQSVQHLGWAIPIGRHRNGRFARVH